MTDKNSKLLLSNTAYDVLNRTVKYVLPGLGTFYFTIAGIWGLPYAEQVVGTLVALATLLGVFLALSNHAYKTSEAKYDGDFVVQPNAPQNERYRLEMPSDIGNTIEQKNEITLKVNTAKPAPTQPES